MKRIAFPLTSPVRLTPLSGQTQVELTTTGTVLVSGSDPVRLYRDRSLPVAATKRGKITSSPKGSYLTLKVILPTLIASEREFHHQVELLFDAMRLDRV